MDVSHSLPLEAHLAIIANPESRPGDMLKSIAAIASSSEGARHANYIYGALEKAHASGERYSTIELLKIIAESPARPDLAVPLISQIVSDKMHDGAIVSNAAKAIEAFGFPAHQASEIFHRCATYWRTIHEDYFGQKRRDEVLTSIYRALLAVDPLTSTAMRLDGQLALSQRIVAGRDQVDAQLLDKIFGREPRRDGD